MHPIDRLVEAEHNDKGIRLTASEVADILEYISEIELQRTLDAIMADKVISSLTGEPSKLLN